MSRWTSITVKLIIHNITLAQQVHVSRLHGAFNVDFVNCLYTQVVHSKFVFIICLQCHHAYVEIREIDC